GVIVACVVFAGQDAVRVVLVRPQQRDEPIGPRRRVGQVGEDGPGGRGPGGPGGDADANAHGRNLNLRATLPSTATTLPYRSGRRRTGSWFAGSPPPRLPPSDSG